MWDGDASALLIPFCFRSLLFLFPGIWLMDSLHSLEWRVLQSTTTVLGTSTNLIIRSNNLKAMKAIGPFSTTGRGCRGYDVDGVDRVDGGAVYGIYVDYLCRYLAGPCCCCGTFIHTYIHMRRALYNRPSCMQVCLHVYPPPATRARAAGRDSVGTGIRIITWQLWRITYVRTHVQAAGPTYHQKAECEQFGTCI